MLRDSPYIIGIILIIGSLIGIGTVMYISDINEDSAVTSLNETLRATTINQVDLSSRTEPGVVYINQDGSARIEGQELNQDFDEDELDFESIMLLHFKDDLASNSIVRFDYAMGNAPIEKKRSKSYKYEEVSEDVHKWVDVSSERYDGDETTGLDLTYPIEGVRVRVRNEKHYANEEDETDSDFWTYQSTVEINRSDKIVTIMEED